MNPVRLFAYAACIICSAMGCNSADEKGSSNGQESSMSPNQSTLDANQAVLSEVNSDASWFHAKKVKPIWAIQATEDGSLETIENREGETESYKAGDFICRGIVGEKWPQSADRLLEKYDATDEVDDKGWRKYVSRPDAKGVFAAQIDHEFMVKAKWGDLHGKSGDYLLKNFEDKDVEYPVDVWIVDKNLFEATYQSSGE